MSNEININENTTAGSSEPFLSVRDLRVEYTSGKSVIKAVNGVSFDIYRGRTLGLVGETGAGKTTIAKAILRILPDPPARMTGGQVLLEGEDIVKLPEKEMLKVRGNRISMIFQDPMTALNPVMTVGSQISEVVQLHDNVTNQQAVVKACEMLEMVGIPAERYVEYPYQFSGGMKQRVVIAESLVCKPELILADEPTTALDVTIQAQVLEMINDLKVKFNTSMLLITHDLGVVAEVCDDVAVIYAGEIIESGNVKDIFLHPTHPYTVGLFGSLPRLDDESPRLKPIKGMPPNPAKLPSGCKFAPRCPYATAQCRAQAVELSEISPGHLCRCIKTDRQEEM